MAGARGDCISNNFLNREEINLKGGGLLSTFLYQTYGIQIRERSRFIDDFSEIMSALR
jgi:hypothetical protein